MALDPGMIVHTVNRWLDTRLRYEGRGRAEFANPKGAVEGPAIVSFGPNGEGTVVINTERVDSPDPAAFSLRASPSQPQDYAMHGGFNPCVSVIVETEAGRFTAADRIIHDGISDLLACRSVQLRPLRSRFEVKGAAQAKYWVMPLCNFVLDYWPWPRHYPELADHPLRVFPTPHVPAELSGEDLQKATIWANQRNGLVTFLVNGQPGFIERLPRYRRNIKRLRRGAVSSLINAVIVGPAHVQSVDFADYENLFPLDVLALLTLATGAPVGAPWIEFRDEQGNLARRIHICFGKAAYGRGHAALHDLSDNAVGYLLTCTFASPERGKKYLRVAANHAVTAGKTGALESRFISICRGFETLCRYHGFRTHDLCAGLVPSQKLAVQNVTTAANGQIRALVTAEGDPGRKRALERIADRVLGAEQREKDFGLAFLDLVRHYGFADPDILQAHLLAHPHPIADSWPGLVAYYRNAAIHDAYFEFSGAQELFSILRVMDHLHDLLLRIIFKILKYDGPYQPPIPPLMSRDNVDWVTPATPAQLLGYI
jgi:hypothetical protein